MAEVIVYDTDNKKISSDENVKRYMAYIKKYAELVKKAEKQEVNK